jgi:hypothetical protein
MNSNCEHCSLEDVLRQYCIHALLACGNLDSREEEKVGL